VGNTATHCLPQDEFDIHRTKMESAGWQLARVIPSGRRAILIVWARPSASEDEVERAVADAEKGEGRYEPGPLFVGSFPPTAMLAWLKHELVARNARWRLRQSGSDQRGSPM
jgi:hypothetical protein